MLSGENMKRVLKQLFIIMFIMIFDVSTYGLNTVRPNKVIFDTGHYIEDGVNEEAGMVSPIPKNVCYKKTLKTEPVECEYTYGQYYTTFASNPVPGTMNIGLDVDPDEDARKLRIMVNNYVGDFLTNPTTIGSIEGFNQGVVVPEPKLLFIARVDTSETVEELIDGTDVHLIDRAYSSLQVGNSRYGESVWIYNDSEENLLTMGAFETVDWSLEPTVPQPFSINAIRQTNEAASPYYPPGNTYLTDHVLVRDLDGKGGQVCINQETALDETGAMDHCPDDGAGKGMFIEGNVMISKLFGLVGFVQFRRSETADDNAVDGWNNGPLYDMPPLNIYLDVNMDGCKGETDNTYDIGLDQTSDCSAQGISVDKLEGFMVSYIGYISIVQDDTYYSGLYWMEMHKEGSTAGCTQMSPNDPNEITSDRLAISNTAVFEYQSRWNEAASFTFLIVEKFGVNDSDDIERQFQFCAYGIDDENSSVNPGGSPMEGQAFPEKLQNRATYGVAAYGIPVSTQPPPQ